MKEFYKTREELTKTARSNPIVPLRIFLNRLEELTYSLYRDIDKNKLEILEKEELKEALKVACFKLEALKDLLL